MLQSPHRRGTSSNMEERMAKAHERGFNPLIVGAPLVTAALAYAKECGVCFNPLIVGAPLVTFDIKVFFHSGIGVSIPSSSGHL